MEDLNLVNQIRSGNKRVFDELAELYGSLIYRLARGVSTNSAHLEDLLQEGRVGLFEAARDYKPEVGSFMTYTYWKIRGRMLTWGLKNIGGVSRTPHGTKLAWKIRRYMRDYELEHGEEPSLEHLYEKFSSLRTQIPDILNSDLESISFVTEEGAEFSEDTLEATRVAESPEKSFEYAIIRDQVENLPDTHRVIVQKHFGIGGGSPMTFVDIGKDLGMPRSTVHKRFGEALVRLRGGLTDLAVLR